MWSHIRVYAHQFYRSDWRAGILAASIGSALRGRRVSCGSGVFATSS
jgi:hypothetical protein